MLRRFEVDIRGLRVILASTHVLFPTSVYAQTVFPAVVSAEESTSDEDDRVQLNVTFRQGTLDDLRQVFPAALEDSERVRQAVAQSIERSHAAEYMIRQS